MNEMIVVDKEFDREEIGRQVRAFLEACNENDLPTALLLAESEVAVLDYDCGNVGNYSHVTAVIAPLVDSILGRMRSRDGKKPEFGMRYLMTRAIIQEIFEYCRRSNGGSK